MSDNIEELKQQIKSLKEDNEYLTGKLADAEDELRYVKELNRVNSYLDPKVGIYVEEIKELELKLRLLTINFDNLQKEVESIRLGVINGVLSDINRSRIEKGLTIMTINSNGAEFISNLEEWKCKRGGMSGLVDMVLEDYLRKNL